MSNPVVRAVKITVEWTDDTKTEAHLFDSASGANNWSWHQGGPSFPGAPAESGFGDVLDAWTTRIEEYNSEHTPAFHLHVGANVPTYLPEGDVYCAKGDVNDARERLVDELNTAQDGLPECESPQSDGAPCGQEECGGCAGYGDIQDAIKELRALTDAGVMNGYYADVHDGRALPVRHWITRVDPKVCEINNDDD